MGDDDDNTQTLLLYPTPVLIHFVASDRKTVRYGKMLEWFGNVWFHKMYNMSCSDSVLALLLL